MAKPTRTTYGYKCGYSKYAKPLNHSPQGTTNETFGRPGTPAPRQPINHSDQTNRNFNQNMGGSKSTSSGVGHKYPGVRSFTGK